MAELPKEELVKIAEANTYLLDVAKNLVATAETDDKVAGLIYAQIDTILDISRKISAAVSAAH